MSRKLVFTIILTIWGFAAFAQERDLVGDLTAEEANRPSEKWTDDQGRAKGWTPYHCGFPDGDQRQGVGRWPANKPPDPNASCVTYSFMPLIITTLCGFKGTPINNWPVVAGANTQVTIAAATWMGAADITLNVVADGGGNWNVAGAAGLTGNIRIGSANFGAGGEIAHAYFPPPNGVSAAGDMHFNKSLAWVTGGAAPGPPYDVQTVALHEFGHALGLTHAGAKKGDVMFRFYTGINRVLQPRDTNKIVGIYGTKKDYAKEDCIPIGACAVDTGCVLTTEDGCSQVEGEWQGNTTTCEGDLQPAVDAVVPSSAEWGVIILLVLLLGSGVWVIMRRRKAATVRI